jgi:hypothetical protein
MSRTFLMPLLRKGLTYLICNRIRNVNNWRVRSTWHGAASAKKLTGRGGASGHDRPNVSGRAWVLTGLKPDAGCNASSQFCSASGRCFVSVGPMRSARLVNSSCASGYSSAWTSTFKWPLWSNEWNSKWDTWRSLERSWWSDRTLCASGQVGPACPVTSSVAVSWANNFILSGGVL